MKKRNLRSSLQGILWSKSLKKLDLRQDKNYVIHQVLSYGDIPDIRWLFKTYSCPEIAKTFIRVPKKIYQPAVFYFVKNFLLGLNRRKLNEKKYIKSIY